MSVKLSALISFSILGNSVQGLLMLILKMLHLLLVSDNPNIVLVLCIFHLSVVVAYLRFKLFDILTRIMIKVMNHVFLNLQHVSFDFCLVKLFLKVLNSDLKLRTHHGHVVIFRFHI